MSPSLQVDSLPAEAQGKPRNIGVSNLFLLQWIFWIQETNQGLLHCRRILYQLSSQGSPTVAKVKLFVNSDFFGRKRTLSFATKFSLLSGPRLQGADLRFPLFCALAAADSAQAPLHP